MSRDISPEDVEKWAEKNGYDEEDLSNFAGALQVGQLLLQHFVPDMKDDYGDEIDEAYEAVFRASPLDDELPETYEQYVPHLAMDSHNIDDVLDD